MAQKDSEKRERRGTEETLDASLSAELLEDEWANVEASLNDDHSESQHSESQGPTLDLEQALLELQMEQASVFSMDSKDHEFREMAELISLHSSGKDEVYRNYLRKTAKNFV